MKKLIKKVVTLLLIIQIALASTIFSGFQYADTHNWKDPNTGLSYYYNDSGFLYLGDFQINGKNASAQFTKSGGTYLLAANDQGGYTVDVAGVPQNLTMETLLSALGLDTGGDIKTFSEEDIKNLFGVNPPEDPGEPDEPEPPGDSGKYNRADYAKYSFSGSTLQVTFISQADGSQIKSANYSYDASAKKFTIIGYTNENCAFYSDYNDTPLRYELTKDTLPEVGVPEEDFPGELGDETPPSTPTTPGGSTNEIDKAIDGVAGLILYPMKMVPLIIGKVISWIMNLFAEGPGGVSHTLTVSDILFNQIELTKIDFFNFSSSSATVSTIRESVAIWYYGIRNLSAIILICILIYVGIRMAVSTIAEDKAKYKQMLIDWFVGLALLFVLHYIMVFIIYINNALVSILARPLTTANGQISDGIMEELWNHGWAIGFTEGMGSAICYMLLLGVTFIFLLSYIKRMITIGFLIVIAPLVTVTYSIDKMGDRKISSIKCMD